MGSEIIRQFNAHAGQNKSLIRKALDSSSAKGQALIPEYLEQVITNTITRLSPELAMVSAKFGRQKFHEFNQIKSLPKAGGAMGENATTPTRASAYERKQLPLKIVRRKGAVTNFLQDTSGDYIDAAASEMENHLLAHAYDMSTYITHGNAGADPYTFSGLDHFISTNRKQEVVAGVAPSTLEFLDEMIDININKQGAHHKKAFLMSPEMLSKVSRLLTMVRLNQSMGVVDLPGGWRLNAYRDIPIIVSSAMRPKGTMGTVTISTATTGGTIPSSTAYFFRVAPVTYDGEQVGSAQVTVTTGAGTETNTIKLEWGAYEGAMFYRIYAGTVTGQVKLVRVISAFEYDGNGTPTGDIEEFTFTAVPTVRHNDSVTEKMADDVPFNISGGIPTEQVMLWDLDEYQGMGKLPYTNTGGSKFGGLVTVTPLAITDDFVPFMVKSYAGLCPSFEATSVIHRGLKTA